MSAVESVRNALAGGDLDTDVLEQLSYDPYAVDSQRAELVPLLAQLLATRPEVAREVPETLVNVLLRKMPLNEVLAATHMNAESLDNAIVRPILLNQLVLKARQSENECELLLQRSFELIAQPQLDGPSVALIEKLTLAVPLSARKFVPFETLFNGDAHQKSRLMELNGRLLSKGVSPPLEFGFWDRLDGEDLVLCALQTEYVGAMLDSFLTVRDFQPVVRHALFLLAQSYDADSLLSNPVETVLAKTCRMVETVFLELDAQFSLVKPDRIALLARLPSSYIVKHHFDIVSDLEVTARTLPAVANIARNFDGLVALQIPQARLLNMVITSQLLVAAAAISNSEGARYFSDRYKKVLDNVVSAPITEDTRELKMELELNMRMFGLYYGRGPQVATSNEE